MQMHKNEYENKIWPMQRFHSQALDVAGYGYIILGKPHIAASHFLKKTRADPTVQNNTGRHSVKKEQEV